MESKKTDTFDEKLYEDHMNEIKSEIDNFPIITEVRGLFNLKQEFNNNNIFLDKLNQVGKTHSSIRQLRKDGSCFYRAYIFRLFELLIIYKGSDLYNKFIKKFTEMKDFLVKADFDLIVFEDYLDNLLEVIKKLNTIDELEKYYSKIENCNSIMMIIRFVTSAYIKNNKFFFENYFLSDNELFKFCHQEVENIESEADQYQIIALNSYFDMIKLNIFYIDNNPGTVHILKLPEDDWVKDIEINLLYRPGHYDLLYKNN